MSFKKYDLENQLKEFGIAVESLTQQIESRAKQSISLLAQQVYAKIIEKAQEKLKSTRNTYIANLGMMNESDNLYVVYLKKEADFIENGIKPHEMIDDFIKSPKAKTAKDGSKYLIIPFKHNKSPQDTSRAQMQVQNVVKRELKSRGLDKTIMLNGKPQLGRVASLDLVGKNMPTAKFNKPILAGLTIYQREEKMKNGKTRIKRDVMTFRVASSKQKGSGMWFHHGSPGAKIFESMEKEVDQMWNEILNDIIGQVKIEIKPGG